MADGTRPDEFLALDAREEEEGTNDKGARTPGGAWTLEFFAKGFFDEATGAWGAEAAETTVRVRTLGIRNE